MLFIHTLYFVILFIFQNQQNALIKVR